MLILSSRLEQLLLTGKQKLLAGSRFRDTTSAVTVAQLASHVYPFTVERSCAQYPLQFCHAQHQPALKSTAVLCCTSTKTCQHTQLVSGITNFPFSQYLSPFLQLLHLSLSYCFMFTGAGTCFAFFVKHPALWIPAELLGTVVTEAVQIN